MVNRQELGALVEAELYRRGAKREGGQLRIACVAPQHAGNRDKDARYSPEKQTWCCYVCGASGGLVVGAVPLAKALGIDGVGDWSPEQRAEFERELEQTRLIREAAEARKVVALRDYWEAHRELRTAEARGRVLEYLLACGIRDHAAEHFGLTGGTWKGAPALVIPWSSRGVVKGIQYRFLTGAQRYETHPGSILKVFNADAVTTPVEDSILVVEGAKKCAALWSAGWHSVCAVRNKSGWSAGLAKHFASFDRVVFALDPDATTEARDAARTVGNGYVAMLPMKPDDMLAETRGDLDLLNRYVQGAERIAA